MIMLKIKVRGQTEMAFVFVLRLAENFAAGGMPRV